MDSFDSLQKPEQNLTSEIFAEFQETLSLFLDKDRDILYSGLTSRPCLPFDSGAQPSRFSCLEEDFFDSARQNEDVLLPCQQSPLYATKHTGGLSYTGEDSRGNTKQPGDHPIQVVKRPIARPVTHEQDLDDQPNGEPSCDDDQDDHEQGTDSSNSCSGPTISDADDLASSSSISKSKRMRLTCEVRQRIIHLHMKNFSLREIAKRVQCTLSAVQYTVKKYSCYKTVENLPKSGRTPILQSISDELLFSVYESTTASTNRERLKLTASLMTRYLGRTPSHKTIYKEMRRRKKDASSLDA